MNEAGYNQSADGSAHNASDASSILAPATKIPPQKGDRKSYAVREIGKTGMRVAAVGCECMSGESLRLQFGAGLKSFSEFTEPMERVGRSPAPSPRP